MNIALTGFMATGKTAVARAVAELSDFTFEDTDSMIVTKTGMSINDIFSKHGEEYFRQLEREAVREVSKRDNTVIATGGGVVLDKSNIAALRENGVIINLAPDFKVIEERVENARATRPLMKNESMEQIRKRFEERREYYDDCDMQIRITSDATPHATARVILEYLGGIK